eukprot:gene19064-24886_t
MAKLAFIDNIDVEFVATCGHIYWNPNKPEVKLAQTVFWLDRIKRFSTYSIDTAIDRSNSQNKASTKEYKDFFNRAKLENRIILTTSRQMRERTSCPRSTFVSTNNLEDALVNICKEYNIILDKEKLLTVCGKCGGEIESCDHNDDRINGRHVPSDRPVFICVDCNQPYWWNDKADSSPARAMRVGDYEAFITINITVNLIVLIGVAISLVH